MISKELLSEVLGKDIFRILNHIENKGTNVQYTEHGAWDSFNIHELAHKCKEWARSKDYHITSGNRTDGTTRYDVMCAYKDTDIENWDDFFSGMFDTEPEAIFKACEWILQQKAKS